MNRIVEPPLGHFEERLLAELKAVVASRTADDPRTVRGPRRQRARLVAVTATGVAAAVAVGLVLMVPGHTVPGYKASARSPGFTLAAFMTAAAAAALAQDTSLPAPDQAFYVKEDIRLSPPDGGFQECAVRWDLYPLSGKGFNMTFHGKSSCGSSLLLGLKFLTALTAGRPALPTRHYYPPLGSLPDTPAALRSALYAAAGLGPAYWTLPSTYTANDVVFTLVGRLLEAPVSGALRALVYQVIAGLPAVTLVRTATDAIGRHGVGIQLSLPALPGTEWTLEIIIDPVTYRFLGMDSESGSWHQETADIGSGLVTRPAP